MFVGAAGVVGYGEVGGAAGVEEVPEFAEGDGGRDAEHVGAVEPEVRGGGVEEVGVDVAAEAGFVGGFEGEDGDEAAGLVVEADELLESWPAGGVADDAAEVVGGGGEVEVAGAAGVLIAELGVFAGPGGAVAEDGVDVEVAPVDSPGGVFHDPGGVGGEWLGAALGVDLDGDGRGAGGGEAGDDEFGGAGGEGGGGGEAVDSGGGFESEGTGVAVEGEFVGAEGVDAKGEGLPYREDGGDGGVEAVLCPEGGFGGLVEGLRVHHQRGSCSAIRGMTICVSGARGRRARLTSAAWAAVQRLSGGRRSS